MFGKRNKTRKVTTQNTTEELAIAFLQNAVGSINAQLKIEVERNGFSAKDLTKGKIKLVRTVVHAESDSRFVGETFAIQVKGRPDRMIMAVKWSPNAYVIERHSDQVANAIKANPNFGVKKESKGNSNLILSATTEQIEIEARAAEYVKKHNDKLHRLN